ncbi:dTMP kinase [Streptomyces sp. P38-E01]|uniref:Thymidylate kinase n=1 Tax=Streptomyces tardus TaxID=2780544 RepID=A0A949JBX8_9ACTN|nr:dTMP kinase [Streptomyces tardus]MBU7597248.1 dTMP kinase [Streptomyces tardus]
MTRAEQPTVVNPTSEALAAESRERAIRALVRHAPLRRLWSAQCVSGVADVLALFVLTLLAMQATLSVVLTGGEPVFGAGYSGLALVVAAVFGTRLLSTFLFGAVLLGPLSSLVAPGNALDRRWTMIVTDALRGALLIVAPLWITWSPDNAYAILLITVFVTGVAERFWTVAGQSAAPALLPAPPAEGAAVRPLPDHNDALRRLSLRTSFLAVPAAASVLLVVTLLSNLLGSGIDWFTQHQAALASYVAAGLFAASVSVLVFLQLPSTGTPRPRSPLEGLRRPKNAEGTDKGRTGAVPLLVVTAAAVAAAIAAAVAVAVLHAMGLGGGPVTFALLALALTGGTAVGIRFAGRILPTLPRRRLLGLALIVCAGALIAAGLLADTATALLTAFLAGVSAGVAAHTAHTLIDLEVEEFRRPRMAEHLAAVVRIAVAFAAVVAPVLAALIGQHRVQSGSFVLDQDGAGFTLVLAGALLLPVAALVLSRVDDRGGVPLRRDLLDALRGDDPAQAPSTTGFFIAVEGGDGAGKSTQVEALATWMRDKGHEVVVTREPGATAIGKRLRSILLDISSEGLSGRAEALLYAADRAEHVDSVVRPALERGAVVISDRYIDSSVAYQGAGRELSATEIARMSRWATSGLVPHLTVLLDISPETARERFTEAPDRLESESAEFHQRVRSGFLTLAAADPVRYLVVDAGQEAESVTTVVRHRLDLVLPLSEKELEQQEEARRKAEEERRRREEEEAARKAEEERQERERQEQLAKLRADEEERRRQEAEAQRRAEEARVAEEARRKAEEARQRAEEERKRREAEEAARQAEQERLRRQKEGEERLRAEAEARRLEKQRKAEESLLLAEQARQEKAARRAEEERQAEEARQQAEARRAEEERGRREAESVLRAEEARKAEDARTAEETRSADAADGAGAKRSAPKSSGSDEDTVQTPQPAVPESTSEETTVLPQFAPDEAETSLLPRVQAEESGADRTRELPQVDEQGRPRQQRPRSDWAEETPMDDLPTLADELLGPYGEEGNGDSRGGSR